MKHDTDNRTSALETTRSLLRRLKNQNVTNFGLQTAKIIIGPEFLYPLLILHFTLLPGFAHEGQQTELNQTLTSGRK